MPSNAHRCILIADDDRLLAEGLAAGLSRNGRTVIVCNDIESAEMALVRFPVTDVVTDVQFTSGFGFEGLHFANRTRSGKRPHRTVLMTGTITDALRTAAPAFGADAILEKPFTLAELESALKTDDTGDDGDAEMIRVRTIDELIAAGSFTVAFQPVVSLRDDAVTPYGFEALTRMREPWALGGTPELFAYASKSSKLEQLNRECMRAAVREAPALPGQPLLFVNADPSALDGRFASMLAAASGQAGIPLDRVVVEITERSSFPDEELAARALGELRSNGVRFALDDHGSAYSHLDMIRTIAPSFIKISASFGTGFEKDVYKQTIVQHIVTMARDFGAMAILEGVETAETAAIARQIGVPLAQGFFFGRPAAASLWPAGMAA
jgi:EAL domain-containing protein (putative c-di-GMP-specific phosphodiesterase class I)